MKQPILDHYAATMADLQLSRNPLSEECILIFNTVTRDHYQDAVVTETVRVKKRCLIKKNLNMHYVQEEGYELLEDTQELPWIISVTMTGLPRVPQMDDQVMVDGIKYTVAEVRPANRSIRSIVLLSVYPERAAIEDQLAIYSVTHYHTDVVSIVYGGKPTAMSFSEESLGDKTKRVKFRSFVHAPEGWTKLFVFDDNNNFAVYKNDIPL